MPFDLGLETLVPLPVVLPLVGAAVALAAARRPGVQRAVSVTVLSLLVAVSLALLFASDARGPLVVEVGGWPAPAGVVLVVDRLAALMLVVSSVIQLGVLLYSVGQGRASDD